MDSLPQNAAIHLPITAATFLSRVPPGSISKWIDTFQFIEQNDLRLIHLWSMPTEDPAEVLKHYIACKSARKPLSVMMMEHPKEERKAPKRARYEEPAIPVHSTEGLQCLKCTERMCFTSHRAYINHLKRHDAGPVYVCCSKEYHSKEKYDRHKAKHCHICEFCPLRFKSEEEAKKHMHDVHLEHPGVPGTTLLENIPVELFQTQIMPHLKLEDMTELRKVSKSMLAIVDDQKDVRPAFLSRKNLLKSAPDVKALSYYSNYRGGHFEPLFLCIAINNDQQEVIQWLCSHYREEIEYNRVNTFIWACSHGHIKVAMWMHQHLTITREDACARDDQALRDSCKRGYLQVVAWLCTTFEISKEVVMDDDANLVRTCPSAPTVKWLYKSYGLEKQDLRMFNDYILERACERGDLDMIKFLHAEIGFVTTDFHHEDYQMLRKACKNGHIETVVYLCDQFDFDIRVKDNNIIGVVCANDHLELAMWITERFDLKIEDVRCNNNYALRKSCERGHLGVLTWLFEQFKLQIEDVRSVDNFALRRACAGNRYEILKYLCSHFELTREDVRANDNEALVDACMYDHFEMVKWICGQFDLEAEDVRSGALLESCARGSLHIVEWLCSRFKLTKEYYEDNMFQLACENGRTKTAKWLISYFKLTRNDIISDGNHAFFTSCANGHLSFSIWLHDKYGVDMEGDRALIVACENGHLEMVQWLCNTFEVVEDSAMDAFHASCVRCDIPMAEWIANRFGFTRETLRSYKHQTFQQCCKGHRTKILEWMQIKFKFTEEDIRMENNEALALACKHNCLNVAQYLVERFGLTKEDIRPGLRDICVSNGQLGMVAWIDSL